MPLGRAGLGGAPAEFRGRRLFPAQMGSLLPKGLWLCFERIVRFWFPL